MCQPLFQVQYALNSRCTGFLLVVYHWQDLHAQLQPPGNNELHLKPPVIGSSKQSPISTMLCFHWQGLCNLPETGREDANYGTERMEVGGAHTLRSLHTFRSEDPTNDWPGQ